METVCHCLGGEGNYLVAFAVRGAAACRWQAGTLPAVSTHYISLRAGFPDLMHCTQYTNVRLVALAFPAGAARKLGAARR